MLWIFVLSSAFITNLLVSSQDITELQESVRPTLHSLKIFPKDRKPNPKARIVGGEEAIPHSHPYIAALYIYDHRDDDETYAFYGGSLITPQWILTAAHCVEEYPNVIKAVLGAHDISDSKDVQTIYISFYLIHEGYSVRKVQNDIALLMLSRKARINRNVKTVQLANRNEDYLKSRITVVGWGKTEEGVSPTRLKSVSLSIISNNNCDKIFGEIVPSQICASGEGNKGSCSGDSGGPLVMGSVQIGLVSFGSDDCTKGAPTVYTRISSFNKWIWKSVDSLELRYSSADRVDNKYLLLISVLVILFYVIQ